jgi:hypothetical protein
VLTVVFLAISLLEIQLELELQAPVVHTLLFVLTANLRKLRK